MADQDRFTDSKTFPQTLETSSVEPDEMTVSATSSLDLHCEPLSVWQIITFMIYFLFYSCKPEENVDAPLMLGEFQ